MNGKEHDIKLQKINNIYDIDFSDDGDFILEEGFNTYITIALLTDERCDNNSVSPILRRGWWGKSINNKDNPDLQYGSKLWLLTGRKTQKQKNDAIDFAEKALEGLVQNNELKSIDVSGIIDKLGISLLVNFIRNNENPSSLNYNLWQSTLTE